MESPTPSLREQGVQALREGNLDGAIDLLARAVMTDGQDAEAQAFLGVAYSQKGLHAQAKRALQTATELQPHEARFRFNLGVALEAAGDAPGAAAAYQETLRLNPAHPQASARLQGRGSQAAAPGPAAPPSGAAVPGAPSPYGQPDASAARPTWMAGQQQAAAGAAPAAPPGAPWLAGQQSAAAAGPPGTVQCPSCKQWSRPGLSCEWCSTPLKSTAASSYGAPGQLGGGATAYDAPRPFGLSLLVVLYDIGAIFTLIVGVLMMLGGGFAGIGGAGGLGQGAPPGMAGLGAIVAVVGVVVILWAVGVIVVGHFLWKGFNWARIVFMVLVALSVLGNLASLAQQSNSLIPLLQLVVGVCFLIVLNTRATKEYCSH